MLLWIVDLILASPLSTPCKLHTNTGTSVQSVDQLDSQGQESVETLSEVEQADRMFFEYLTRAYAIWLNGADETEVIDRALLENFGNYPVFNRYSCSYFLQRERMKRLKRTWKSWRENLVSWKRSGILYLKAK
jgi:SMC interacting uncharacterized protein involved in chromosome segregation